MNVLVWSYVEVGIGVVAACLPTLKPLFYNYSVDSIVASLCSKLSLRSINSDSRGRKHSSRVLNGPSDLELFPYDASNHTHSHISGVVSSGTSDTP